MTITANRRSVLKGAISIGATSCLGSPLPAMAADVSNRPGWDLTDLYPTDAAWVADRRALETLIGDVAAFHGRLGRGAEVLRAALQTQSDARRKLGRLTTYAQAKAAEDTSVAASQLRVQLVRQLAGRLERASAFTAPELVALGRAKVVAYFEADPGLSRFRLRIDDALRLSEHTLGEQAEGVIAATATPFGGPLAVVNQLNASDIPRPSVTLSDGSRVKLDNQAYGAHSSDPNRADRKLVFEAFYGSYEPFQSTLGADLLAQVEQECFTAQVRHYPTALSAALDPQAIPVRVYRTFVEEANAGLPVYHRYLDLRRRLLGLPQLAYYDLYAPVGASKRRFTPAEMRTIMLQAVKPLGPDYVARLAAASGARWTDPLPRPNKLPGNFMDPGAYDVHPYLMFNLSDDYGSMSDYVHEWGHAMHSLLANAAQPYETAGYAQFVAEVPSQFNEILLGHFMVEQAKTRAEKLSYLLQLLTLWTDHFFNTAMTSEFQDRIHAPVEAGGGLTGEGSSAAYLELQRRYYGSAVSVDPVYGLWWARDFQLWEGYFTFQYATCITAAGVFSERVLSGDARARERYLGVLRAGGSNYAYDVLRDAGVNLATPEPYRLIIAQISKLIERAEALV